MAKAHRGFHVMLPYVHSYRDRHGKVRHYFYLRRPGWTKIRLPGEPGSDEFMAAYLAAKARMTIDRTAQLKYRAGSVANTIALYYTDNSFLSLRTTTQKMRRAFLERLRKHLGDAPVKDFKEADIARLLGRMKPFAAKNMLTTLRGLFKFAAATGLRPDDPTTAIKPMKLKAGSIHTWTEDEIEIFERHHAIGTRARLAMALMLYTAARRGDAIRLGPQHIRAGRLYYRQQKTGRTMEIPIHPQLAQNIDGSASGHLTFLVTAHGTPFTPDGFGNWFREMCDQAGLPQCSAHGLRKAQARRLAEAGCSAHEIAAITGHKTLAEVQRYAEAANQSKLAESAFRRTGGER